MIPRIRSWDSHKSIERALWTLLGAVLCLLYYETSDHPEILRTASLVLAILLGLASIVITFTRVSQDDKREKNQSSD